MLNLHQIAAGAISIVNPNSQGIIRQSAGYTTSSDGTRVPSYLADLPVTMQVQSASNEDLRQIEGLNLQGGKSIVIYLYGDWSGLVRHDKQGGDLLIYNSQIWLIVAVMENWPTWSKVAVTLQNGS